MMFGRLLSFWDGISSGAMLNFRWVSKKNHPIRNRAPNLKSTARFHDRVTKTFTIPIPSMYGIFTQIFTIQIKSNQRNADKYNIHGPWYGIYTFWSHEIPSNRSFHLAKWNNTFHQDFPEIAKDFPSWGRDLIWPDSHGIGNFYLYSSDGSILGMDRTRTSPEDQKSSWLVFVRRSLKKNTGNEGL